jgi:outer membrane protein assembly factor BamB
VFPLGQRWLVALRGETSAPPVVDDARVYVPIEGRQLEAFSLVDGTLHWSVELQTIGPLAVGDNCVFASTREGVVALWATTGDVRWEVPLGELAAPLRWHAGWLLAGTVGGELVALRGSDGMVIWRQNLGVAAAVASVEGDRLYVPLEDGRILALKVDTGATVWEARLGGAGEEIIPLPDRVYVGSVDNRFYCLSARDGHQDWQWRTGADVLGGAAVDAARVYFVSLDNALYALDRRSGVRQWRLPLPTRAVGPPSLAGPAVFVPLSSRVMLFALREEGRPLIRVALPADLFAATPFDPASETMLVAVTVDAVAGTRLVAFGRALAPSAVPLTALPGLNPSQAAPLGRNESPY